jgi:ribosomal protein L7/L12
VAFTGTHKVFAVKAVMAVLGLPLRLAKNLVEVSQTEPFPMERPLWPAEQKKLRDVGFDVQPVE